MQNVLFVFSRDGLLKMKAAYEQNPALGDPVSIDQQLPDINNRIEKLQTQLKKYQVTNASCAIIYVFGALLHVTKLSNFQFI